MKVGRNSKFTCDKCGLCCKYIDISVLGEEFDDGNGGCKYYDDSTKLCTIYEDRPYLCNVGMACENLEPEEKAWFIKNLNKGCKLLKEKYKKD